VCGRNAPTVTQAPQSRLADSGRPPAASLLGMPRPTRSRVWRFAVSCERVALRPPGRGRQLPLIPSSILFGRRCQARGLAALQPTLFRSRVHPRGRVGSAPLLAGNVRTSKKGRTAPCPLARLTRRCAAAEYPCSTQFRYSASPKPWMPAVCCRSRRMGQARCQRLNHRLRRRHRLFRPVEAVSRSDCFSILRSVLLLLEGHDRGFIARHRRRLRRKAGQSRLRRAKRATSQRGSRRSSGLKARIA